MNYDTREDLINKLTHLKKRELNAKIAIVAWLILMVVYMLSMPYLAPLMKGDRGYMDIFDIIRLLVFPFLVFFAALIIRKRKDAVGREISEVETLLRSNSLNEQSGHGVQTRKGGIGMEVHKDAFSDNSASFEYEDELDKLHEELDDMTAMQMLQDKEDW